ncbi:hypothetical protein F7725_008598 [Dissostichus mawsoni]|uniref:Uncharacterized protein n=1 Tax=Dissostichus mawsoni TaxID=36200 RepID=A0A7J5Y7M5_DISMA|nr:hypothetical protein F7725_008598 [Dissostichus mawsoni]
MSRCTSRYAASRAARAWIRLESTVCSERDSSSSRRETASSWSICRRSSSSIELLSPSTESDLCSALTVARSTSPAASELSPHSDPASAPPPPASAPPLLYAGFGEVNSASLCSGSSFLMKDVNREWVDAGAMLLSDNERFLEAGASIKDSHWKPSIRGMSPSSWLWSSCSIGTISIPNLKHTRTKFDVASGTGGADELPHRGFESRVFLRVAPPGLAQVPDPPGDVQVGLVGAWFAFGADVFGQVSLQDGRQVQFGETGRRLSVTTSGGVTL